MTTDKSSHTNQEKTVKCPACEDEVLARGLHLHVLRSSDDEHGEQGTVPDELDLDNPERVGKESVTMDYPTEREGEEVARLCPYCRQTFTGKHGVMIHLGQMAGRKNHPTAPTEKHDPTDFPVVSVDDDGNVLEVVEEGTQMPSTERRQEAEKPRKPDKPEIREYINSLRENGQYKEAEKAEQMLLN